MYFRSSLTHFILEGEYPLSVLSNSFYIPYKTVIRNYTNMPACLYLELIVVEHDYETENSRTLSSSSFLPTFLTSIQKEASHCPQLRYVKLKTNSNILGQCENVSSLNFYFPLRNMNQCSGLFYSRYHRPVARQPLPASLPKPPDNYATAHIAHSDFSNNLII